MKKTRVVVLFGGRSAEHEVSIMSARNVIAALPKDKYEVIPIAVDKEGMFLPPEAAPKILASADLATPLEKMKNTALVLVRGDKGAVITSPLGGGESIGVDVILPIMHGPFGEDGAVQGLARMANIPVVGCDVLGSAINMDKDVTKRLLRDGGINISEYILIYKYNKDQWSYEKIAKTLGDIFYMKPANMGSSVGVARIKSAREFDEALKNALKYDTKILCEEEIIGEEMECAVISHDDIIETSVIGRIVTSKSHDFYDYNSKYIDESGATLEMPAKIDKKLEERIRETAARAFEITCCEGMARVDFFYDPVNDKLYINELNTIPGFTNISMFPKLWELSGIANDNLLEMLIEDAIRRHQDRMALSVEPG